MGKANRKAHRVQRAVVSALPTKPCIHCGRGHRLAGVWCLSCTSVGRSRRRMGGAPGHALPGGAVLQRSLADLLEAYDA